MCSGTTLRSLLRLGFLAALLPCLEASAHEFWLVAHDAATGLGKQVVFELRIGPTWPGVQTARLPNLVASFEARDALGVQAVVGRDGAMAVGHVRPRVAGATVIAMRTRAAQLQLSGPEFNQYLQEEGLSEVLQLRKRHGLLDAPGRESFSRCAKSIVWVDQRSDGFERLMGLPLELVPRSDPLAFAPGTQLAMQILFHGQPLAGVLIKAQLKADPPVELKAISDAQGRVLLPLPRAGLWLFNAVHMVPAADEGADWESLWASLTMRVQER